jgi:hypothetical protein
MTEVETTIFWSTYAVNRPTGPPPIIKTSMYPSSKEILEKPEPLWIQKKNVP